MYFDILESGKFHLKNVTEQFLNYNSEMAWSSEWIEFANCQNK